MKNLMRLRKSLALVMAVGACGLAGVGSATGVSPGSAALRPRENPGKDVTPELALDVEAPYGDTGLIEGGQVFVGLAVRSAARGAGTPPTARGVAAAVSGRAAATYPKPTLDEAVKLAPLTLKTAGKKPEEAFTMLGKEVGVTFLAGRDTVDRKQVSVWESRTYAKLEFDVEGANFWQAALRLGDAADLLPWGERHSLTLSRRGYRAEVPLKVMDMRALRVQLFGGVVAGRAGGGGKEARLNMEFLVDPRLAVLGVEPAKIQTLEDSAGRAYEMQLQEVKYPGQATSLSGRMHGIQSISNALAIYPDSSPTTIGVLRGYVPVVVATASQRLEYVIAEGDMADPAPHEIGGWRFTAGKVRVLPTPQGGFSGRGPPPDHAVTLTVQRLKDGAAPFPAVLAAITEIEGSGAVGMDGTAGVSSSAPKDAKTQEWTVTFYPKTRAKLMIDVPTEHKEVVLPFEFRQVVLGR